MTNHRYYLSKYMALIGYKLAVIAYISVVITYILAVIPYFLALTGYRIAIIGYFLYIYILFLFLHVLIDAKFATIFNFKLKIILENFLYQVRSTSWLIDCHLTSISCLIRKNKVLTLSSVSSSLSVPVSLSVNSLLLISYI